MSSCVERDEGLSVLFFDGSIDIPSIEGSISEEGDDMEFEDTKEGFNEREEEFDVIDLSGSSKVEESKLT